MPDLSLFESYETSGEWHLPADRSKKIGGSLSYKAGRTELDLFEGFQPLRGEVRLGDSHSYPIIHGVGRDGNAITLIGALRSSVSINFGSGGVRQPERLITALAIVGAHVSEPIICSALHCRVPGLPMWLARPIIEQVHSLDEESGLSAMSFRAVAVPEQITGAEKIAAEISWGISRHSQIDPFNAINVSTTGWLSIKPKTPQPLDWLLEQFSKITSFLTFLAGTPMSADCITFPVGDERQRASVLVGMPNQKTCSYKSPHDFFLNRHTMSSDLSDVVSRWFDNHEKINHASQLAVSIMASEGLWLHVEFLSLMQALEGFHRGLHDGLYMEDSAYETVKKALVTAIPPIVATDHRSSLKSRIRYGNQISLAKRLDKLAEIMSEPVRKIVFGQEGSIPRTWIDTRNYYTHWDQELRPKILDGQSMVFANIRLRHFVRVLYLHVMGIDQDVIMRALNGPSREAQRIIQINILQNRNSSPLDKSGLIVNVGEASAETSNEAG